MLQIRIADPSIQAPGCAPNAKAVMHQQLDASGARIGKHVAVMGLRGAEDAHHAAEQPISVRTHVEGLHGQPNHSASSSIRGMRIT